MPRRALRLALFACLAALAFLPAAPIYAGGQIDVTISEVSTENLAGDIAALIRQGQQLEVQRRWGEALSHYENAIRQHPNEGALKQRFDTSRLHYDLEHRYTDRSFCDAVARMPVPRALDLYSQVLLKIESHYVDVPHWKELIDRGTGNLEVALGEQTFVERNVPQRDRAAIDDFRRDLRAIVASRVINGRADAREAVAAASRLAQQRLEIASSAVVFEYLCGATNTLDHYSAYLTPDQLNEQYATIKGNFVGLGVELKAQDGALSIVRVIAGSPAEEAGIRAGDQIVAVDGRAMKSLNTDQAANMLQGAEGSVVLLTVASPGQTQRQLSVRRRRVDVPSIDQIAIVDRGNGVAYFKLAGFQETTPRELDAALWKLHRDGMKSLVIDVRGNPGGVLVAAVEAADRFIERGNIVFTRGRIAQEDITYRAHEQGKWQVPLVVIIDQDSASAAELFAGAIRDHRRGTIVGVRSFGKGSVQGIFPLEECNAGLRLTTAKFYSPNGQPYNHVGVEPDITVQRVARPVDGILVTDGDAMLSAAVREAIRLTPTLQARNGI